jgi:DNA processing protein
VPARNLLDWIALSLLPGLGPVSTARALERFGDPGEIAHRVPVSALQGLPGVDREGVARVAELRRDLARRAERERDAAEKLGVRLIARDDEAYPAALAELADAPPLLYVRGEIPPGVARIGIVGSRSPTLYGQRVATGLGAGLAERGIEVVSGGARGIDSCAHRGALETGGRTIAVLGSGLANPYPPENAELFERIVAHGAVVSELALDAPPKAEHFPRRNRLISGLSVAIVVVEAARRSGSLVTARHALEQGREVLAVPGPVSSDRSTGTNALIQQGAKLVQDVHDIVEELSPLYRGAIALPRAAQDDAPNLSGLLPDEEALLTMLDTVEPQQLDDLAEAAPFSFARLQAALFALELRGAIDVLPGHRYLRRGDRS